MDTAVPTQDDAAQQARYARFQTRVSVCAAGGKLCDGWILATIGVVLPFATAQLGISATMEAAIGAASLVGLFFGGTVLGRLTDLLGRQRMFIVTLSLFLLCSIAQFFVQSGTQLMLVRLVMGLAIGADYAIAGPFIAEFSDKRRRGPGLAKLLVWWYVGFVVAATGSILIMASSGNPNMWRWCVASSAVPAGAMLLLRLGMPESPRWLASQGRTDEARRIAEHYLSPETREDIFKEDGESLGYSALFSKKYIRKTALTSIFWMCQITPFFAIYVFLPKILTDINFQQDSAWGEVVLYLFLLVGVVSGVLLINNLGRRKLLLYTFVGQAIALLTLGVVGIITGNFSAGLVILCFIAFAICHAAGSTLQMLYPSEIFPTDIRATGVGFAAGMSRFGSAAGTFLLPMGLIAWGTGPVMIIGGLVAVLGFVVSYMWAPETKGMELSESTQVEVGRR